MPCAPQNLFLSFAQSWASLKIFFWRLPSFGQVSKSFFSVCPASGKSQIIFLAFAQPWASPKIFFYRLPSFGQVSNYFFSVCPTLGKSQIYFLAFAQSEQASNFIFRGLLKWNGRGGACVPARTSAQRRFHTKNTRIVCEEFNDECALAGRAGRHTGTATTLALTSFPIVLSSFNCRLPGGQRTRTPDGC